MGIQLQLTFIAYFVISGWTVVQLHNPSADQAIINDVNDAGRTQGNIQNLLNSIAENNMKKSEAYQEVVEQETAEGQQTFNKLREELQTAQYRNANKRRNLYRGSNAGKDDVMIKREIDDKNLFQHYDTGKPRPVMDEEVCNIEERNNTMLKPGTHLLDPAICEIWYCRRRLLRYAEIDKYTCEYISDWPDVYKLFFKDCTDKKCLPLPKT